MTNAYDSLAVRPAGPWTPHFENDSGTVEADPCPDNSLPGVREYLAAINVAGVALFAVCGVAVLCVVLLYADTLKHILRKAPPEVKTNSAFVLSVYPVVAVATYCAMVVPRAHLLAEAVTQGIFTAALYQMFCLCVSCAGGEAQIIALLSDGSLSLQVGPCCCWPCCCCCLPDLAVTKRHIRMLRILVLQLPVIQALVHMVLLVMWAEEESLYHVNYMFFQPLVAISILFGIWGMTMTVRMLATPLSQHKLNLKFIVLQMVLFLSKLQGLITRIILWTNVFPCKPPISPAVYVNVIYNTMMIAEMVALCFLARILYVGDLGKKKTPDEEADMRTAVQAHLDGLALREERLASSPLGGINVVSQIAPGKLWHLT
ncbi:organic solute transporter subunit alpha [Ischnura elegans]|uniref:organic solute transporter subunit alpha n=1 Tax=Ischnura elegans TaxID=197161 RepID=UPI001ED8905A|nr:organic solute transporter subunit alpha [Ischnura elegans]